jgi:uncharacterized protein with von Willebrand factor type A (vWA) domain
VIVPRDIVDVLAAFRRTLWSYGVENAVGSADLALQALDELTVTDRTDVYWAGRLTFCHGPDDIPRYDAAFAACFGGGGQATAPTRAVDVATVTSGGAGDARAPSSAPDAAPVAAFAASVEEVLHRRDLAELTSTERERALELISALRIGGAQRRSRRHRPARRGPVDRPRTARQMLRSGGEPGRLHRRARRPTARPLLLLVDVSGSMAPYSDAAIVFAHAAVRARAQTEAFTLGTRLTRVTRELAATDPAAAITAAIAAVPDWRSGTRLGDLLGVFLRRWGRAGLARGAVAVIFSDGWERGDPALLAREVAHLRRLAARVIWVNPHVARPGFEPLTVGMAAARPHVAEFVAGHSAYAYAELTAVVTRVARHA